jgi:DNA ligase-1
MTQMNRKGEIDTSSAKLALFDVISLDDFNKGISVKPQYVRHGELCALMSLIQDLKINNIFVVPKLKINFDTKEGYESYINFNKECIDAGYEGIMIKSYDGIYESKRSSCWLKQKPFIELTLKIIDIIEGTGKYQGMMGNIVCTGTDDTGKILEVDVGGGFSDIERSDFWDNKEKYIDFMVEIRADAITKAQNSETYSLRFPRYKGLRGTEKNEKI